ncbi:MAG TPA: hypothetical protein VEH81_03820 [Ktedonobacteraceae bacterium]|nr:hypothetical protein [Ktedonobacteraceae bacterium]
MRISFSHWLKGLGLFALIMFALSVLVFMSVKTVGDSNLSYSLAQPNSNSNANAQLSSSFKFSMVPSPNIKACLPKAQGSVTITPNSLNDVMKVSVSGLAPNTGYDLFVIQLPNKPFGISWYQSDLQTDSTGSGSVTVQGIFNNETFSVSTGGTTTFSPTHQYHLGLWFNDPNVPFKLGCEPGATSPIVTPFNGEQHAGVQVLNTSNFPDNAGPLSHVS